MGTFITSLHMWQYHTECFLEWAMFQVKVVDKLKTLILLSTKFFRKSCRLWDNVAKYDGAGQTIDDNMAHALCMLGK